MKISKYLRKVNAIDVETMAQRLSDLFRVTLHVCGKGRNRT